MTLNERIREAIVGSRKSKADIARACSVTNAAVTHWLNGDTQSLKADKALALEEATGYRARWLLSGRGTKRLSDLYWPFSIEVSRFQALSDKDKGYVEGRLSAAIEQCESATATKIDEHQLGRATPAKSPKPATETDRYPEPPSSSVKTPRVAAVPLPTVTPGGMFGPQVGVKRAGSSNRKTGRR